MHSVPLFLLMTMVFKLLQALPPHLPSPAPAPPAHRFMVRWVGSLSADSQLQWEAEVVGSCWVQDSEKQLIMYCKRQLLPGAAEPRGGGAAPFTLSGGTAASLHINFWQHWLISDLSGSLKAGVTAFQCAEILLYLPLINSCRRIFPPLPLFTVSTKRYG